MSDKIKAFKDYDFVKKSRKAVFFMLLYKPHDKHCFGTNYSPMGAQCSREKSIYQQLQLCGN